MSDWQPIETAPKDGTEILACTRGTKWPPQIVWWEAYGGRGRGQWFYSPDGYSWPTHWMPLPEGLS